MNKQNEIVDNWFVKLVARRRDEPAIGETIYYNVDFKCDQLFRYMWLFDRYAAMVTLARPDLYVEKIIGNIALYDKEEYCNKIRKNKILHAKGKITRIEREGFIPDLFGESEKRYRERIMDAQKALSFWESDGWETSIDLPIRYINKIKQFSKH